MGQSWHMSTTRAHTDTHTHTSRHTPHTDAHTHHTLSHTHARTHARTHAHTHTQLLVWIDDIAYHMWWSYCYLHCVVVVVVYTVQVAIYTTNLK